MSNKLEDQEESAFVSGLFASCLVIGIMVEDPYFIGFVLFLWIGVYVCEYFDKKKRE